MGSETPPNKSFDTSDMPTVPTRMQGSVDGNGPTMPLNVDENAPTLASPSTTGETVTLQPGIAPPTNPSRQPPEIIAGYKRIRALGAGGMAHVYEAEHTTLGRKVALKLLKPSVADSPDFSLRFVRESHAMAQVKHDNVVAIYDAGEADGFMYMALELVPGSDLHKILKRRGRLSVDEAVKYLIGCTKGLAAIHAAGLVHRDIKPANIFVDRNDEPKIGDLGLARAADGDDRMTMTGTSWGTPSYMSPEQIKGVADLDIRADIYSLGATLYTLLAGVEPYVGETSYVITHKVLTEPPPDPRTHDATLPNTVVAIINKAMAKDRKERYQTPQELLEDLERLRGGQRLLHTAPVNIPEPSRAEMVAATLPGTRITTGAHKGAPSIDPFFMKLIALVVVAVVLGGAWYSMQGFSVGAPTVSTTPEDRPSWATVIVSDDKGQFAQVAINGVGVEMRFVPPGTFKMGSPEVEVGRKPYENQRSVTLTNGFWVLSTEVPQLLYEKVMGSNPSSRVGDNLPVEGVSWHEAQEFCTKLQALGIPAQLPTEAQWEFACRAGSEGPFAKQPTPIQQGWMAPPALTTIWRETPADEIDAAVVRWIVQHNGDNSIGIQPIKSLTANALGIFDMHGNVLEWCSDAWDGATPYPDGPGIDPEGKNGGMSVARGGCWFYPPELCRAASRKGILASDALNYVGFRFIIPK